MSVGTQDVTGQTEQACERGGIGGTKVLTEDWVGDWEEEADKITTEKTTKTVEEGSAEATVKASNRGAGWTEKRDWLESVGEVTGGQRSKTSRRKRRSELVARRIDGWRRQACEEEEEEPAAEEVFKTAEEAVGSGGRIADEIYV